MTEPFTMADSEAFIQQLIDKSVEMRRVAEAQQAALDSAAAGARQGDLELVVAPGGSVTSIIFHAEPAQGSPAIWSNDAMQAYRVAAERANRATAEAVIDPAARQAVLDSVPAEVAAQRELDGQPQVDGPSAPSSGTGNTLDDLPSDPSFEAMLDRVLEADDPLAEVAAAREQGLVADLGPRPDAQSIDDHIRTELESVAARARTLGPELQAIRGVADTRELHVVVDAWGGLDALEFRPPALGLDRNRLAEAVLETIRAAEADAATQVRALVAGTEFDDREDPSIGSVLAREEQ